MLMLKILQLSVL